MFNTFGIYSVLFLLINLYLLLITDFFNSGILKLVHNFDIKHN